MDKVITRNLLRSFHNKIKDSLGVATDPEIAAIVDGIDFTDAPVVPTPTPSILTVDESRVHPHEYAANWMSYIAKIDPIEEHVTYVYIPGGKEPKVNVFSEAEGVYTVGTPQERIPYDSINYLDGSDSIFDGYATIRLRIIDTTMSYNDLLAYANKDIFVQGLTWN